MRRTHYPLIPADTRIVYGSQGEGFPCSIVDMELPPLMGGAVHWLANYVMLSRASDLDGLLILRLATREQLTRGAPEYLKAEMQRLTVLENGEREHKRVEKEHRHASRAFFEGSCGAFP